MTKNAAYWIDKLGLQSHSEGGHYRQTYRSDLLLPKQSLPGQFAGSGPVSTAIYFLLDHPSFSAFHRLRSDEMWHFYLGGTLLVHIIGAEGQYSRIQLGVDLEAGEVFQAVVRAGNWFASQVRDPGHFALVGCTVAPGFDFDDFELAKRDSLGELFPQHRALIETLTRS